MFKEFVIDNVYDCCKIVGMEEGR